MNLTLPIKVVAVKRTTGEEFKWWDSYTDWDEAFDIADSWAKSIHSEYWIKVTDGKAEWWLLSESQVRTEIHQ